MARKVNAKSFQSSENLDDLIDVTSDSDDTGIVLLSPVIENPVRFEHTGLIAIGAQAVFAATPEATTQCETEQATATHFESPLAAAPEPDFDEPAENGTGTATASVSASGNQTVDGQLIGVRWAATSITYSDPDAAGDYQAGYFSDQDFDGISAQNEGFSRLSDQQIRAAHFALNADIFTQPAGASGFAVEGFTNLTVSYAGAGAGSGTLRLANTTDAATAYGFYPNGGFTGGDAWFGPFSGTTPVIGNYHWHTVLHEIGHNLGLKHGHETGVYGALPASIDGMEFSIMTYRAYTGGPPGYSNETFGFAQTYMMADIAALQYMYGADFTTNGGDTVYNWSPTTGESFVNGSVALSPGDNRIFSTIWDGNGIDTYDLSNYASSININLTPGGWCDFSVGNNAQNSYLGGGPNGGYARGHVFNALQFNGDARSLIENAIGGSAGDTFTGNVANNTFRGRGGNDTIDGGSGTDSAIFAGVRAQYTLTALAGNGVRVVGPDGTDTLTSIERLVFDDRTEIWPPVAQPPVITSNGGGDTANFTIREARTAVTWVMASDPNGDALTYSIIGGADAAKFAINSATGALALLTAADFENPTDVGSNNSYVVQVRVSDGALTDSQTLTVNIANISEGRKQPPDFNADFQSDLLWRNDNGELASWEMNLGGWGGGQSFGVQQAQWKVAGFGDFNGDGTTDLLWRHDNGRVDTWQLKNGGYNGGQSFGVQPLQWHIEGVGDFNGDGTSDLLWRHDSGRLDTWEMNNGAYAGGKTFGVQSPQWHVVGLGDFNGDGTTDLLWRSDSGQVDTWEMKNGGYAGGKSFGNQPAQWKPIGFGDFNGDATTDILWRHDDGRVATWQMNNGGYGGGTDFGPMPNAWQFLRTGDFNGDGTSDILWRNSITGQLDTWEMRNGGYGGGQHLGAISNDWHIQV